MAAPRLEASAPALRPSRVALLLVDVINPMQFDGAKRLLPAALEAAEPIRRLKSRAAEHGIPAIYVNDNFDHWHLGLRELVESFLRSGVPGAPLIERLRPEPDADYHILKPFQSGFFRTGLEVLLRRLETTTLILTGFAADICVFFTASDAHMRGFEVVVPADCVAAERSEDAAHALRQMARVLKANVAESAALDLEALVHGEDRAGMRIPRP